MTESAKHIVLVMTSDLTSDQRIYRVASTLHGAGYQVTMVGRNFAKALPLSRRLWDEVRLQPKCSHGPRMYYDFNRQAEQVLRSLDADLYYAVDLDTVRAVSRAAKATSTPWIYDAHEYFTEVPELQGRPLKRWVWRWIGRQVRTAAAAITVNDSLASILSTIHSRQFAVVRNVPIRGSKARKVDTPSKRLIYQGAINKGRWVEQYVGLMPQLPDDVTLHIYGDGDEMAAVRSARASSPRRADIYLHGKVSPEVLHQETALSWLGLNVLDVTSKNYYYSLANKFFDYMHAGLPSINSRLPEYQSIIKDHPVGTCIDNSIEDLRQAILTYYQSSDLYELQRQTALSASHTYCWEEEEKALLCLVQQQLT